MAAGTSACFFGHLQNDAIRCHLNPKTTCMMRLQFFSGNVKPGKPDHRQTLRDGKLNSRSHVRVKIACIQYALLMRCT